MSIGPLEVDLELSEFENIPDGDDNKTVFASDLVTNTTPNTET